ncbi:ABC transporter substrate-binding protein [Fundicoccus culcitae]|uniref:ABC transporter substrate-binding protein n=1 Tax=Fundicoccus culcitae TaxID=2969821 RepID=A0ABY5P9D0_9LACT|nr:ABC transporter substrate-binding protein [Fundicoccus culcitae]UUX35364.1 ABC transporter substrate-binding protein [Fundicoccus culcitae]
MNFKKIGLGLVAGVMLWSNSGAVLAQESVLLGGNFELSGSQASYGSPVSEGFDLAIKQMNEAGGLLDGLMIEGLVYDNTSDMTESAAITTRLANEGVVGIIGPTTTGNVLAQVPALEDGQLPGIVPAATGDGLTLDESGTVLDYLFRVCFEDSYQGYVAANYLYDTLGVTQVAVVYDQALDYSVGLRDAFVEQFTAIGGTIVTQETMATGDTDFSSVLTNLLTQNVEALYVPVYYTEGGLFIKQAREFGLEIPVVGADGYHNDTLIELAGTENANNVYYTSHFSLMSDNEKTAAFVAAFEEEYGKQPDTFSALAYDATQLMMFAIEEAGSTDRNAIRDALENIDYFEGVTGSFSIDENHNPVKSVVVIGLENGEETSVIEVAPE